LVTVIPEALARFVSPAIEMPLEFDVIELPSIVMNLVTLAPAGMKISIPKVHPVIVLFLMKQFSVVVELLDVIRIPVAKPVIAAKPLTVLKELPGGIVIPTPLPGVALVRVWPFPSIVSPVP